jgi:hypothetical protein
LLSCQTSGECSAVDIELFLQLQQKQLFSLRDSYFFAYTCAVSNVQYQCLELTLKTPLGLNGVANFIEKGKCSWTTLQKIQANKFVSFPEPINVASYAPKSGSQDTT